MAKALAAVEQAEFVDAAGKKHDWRAEMVAALLARQQANGSWLNPDRRWMEGDPNLSTAFALLALAHCQVAK
jgi:squalene-hopene/tetraprenyl-beta-curcumene cyclase